MKEILTSFEKALMRLEEALKQHPTSLERDAAIQRFESTFELAWKSIQRFLRSEGISCRSPKGCFREAFRYGLIRDDPLWLRMIEDRNLTVHTYDEKIAEKVYNCLFDYLPLFKNLLLKLKAEEQKIWINR
ncbi:MAG: nucleotidyltransferase substrate binding protein [Candidatus Desulfofervidaceae bacterium]|nr:nucleotidyltransferase substrate binding protein [Candidatus Desulfofervidaceae bacterium]